jgi:hypothetical protein
VKETDAIFRHLQQTHRQAAGSDDTLRISVDAKAPVLLGPFSRGGKSRQNNRGADHDFKPWGRLTPFGIFLPDQKDLSLFFTASKVTSDFIVDRLAQWWQVNRERHPKVRKWLLDLDNGPENHSRRTQFIYRLVLLAQACQVTIVLVYYPPYHSKYNPIERCWGVLEVYWKGTARQREGGAGLRREHDLRTETPLGVPGRRDLPEGGAANQGGDEATGRPAGASAGLAEVGRDHRAARSRRTHSSRLTPVLASSWSTKTS